MRKWLRRIRGAIGMGVTWAAALFAVGVVPRWVFGFNADVPFPIVFGVLGFIAGIIFSAVLALTEGGRTLDQMSLPRFAGWGAMGGLLLSALFARAASLGWGDVLAVAPTFALACGGMRFWFARYGQASGKARSARQPWSDCRGRTRRL